MSHLLLSPCCNDIVPQKFTNSTKSIENKKDLRSTDCYEIIPDMELETAIFGTKSYWKRAKLRQIYIYMYGIIPGTRNDSTTVPVNTNKWLFLGVFEKLIFDIK